MADTIAPVSLTPGTRLGAYEVERLLGHGGFGYLYRVARDGRSYALKISRQRPSDLDDEFRADWLARLDREVAALKTLNHRNIVRVHSFDWHPTLDDGYPYIVMDLVEGSTLADWRRRAPRSLREVVKLMAGVADAIGHIHAHGIIHRDLKPANIMVRDDDAAPVIVDFGIARAEYAASVTAAGWSIGTISFFAPEYASFLLSQEGADGGAFQWTTATDLHSLGYIFYELLTGRAPFPLPKQDGGDTAVYATIRSFVPPLPSVRTEGVVPEELDGVVMKLLAKAPGDRPASGEELASALRGLLEQAGPAWDQPLPSPAKARPAMVAVKTNVVAKGAGPASPPAAAPPRFAAIPEAAPAAREVEEGPRAGSPAGVAKAVEFSPPTAARPRMTELGRAKPKAEPEREEAVPVMATEVRRSLEQLEPKRAGLGTGTKVLLGGAVVIAVLFGALVIGAMTQPQPTQKLDLLKAVEQRKREEQAREALQEAAPKPAEAPARPVTLTEDAAPPPPPAGPGAGGGAAAQPATAPKLSPEEAEVAAAAAPRGARSPSPAPRRTQEPPPVAYAVPSAQNQDWLKRSTRLGGAAKPARADKVGVPLGAHVRVRLLSNLDSRTLSNAPIEAVLPAAYFVGDNLVLPARTVLFGVGQANGGRFLIEFSRMRLPDNSEVEFRAVAMDLGDGKPGLRAGRSIVPERSENAGLGSRIARNAAGTAVSLAPMGTGVATSVAKGAAGDAISGSGGGVEEVSGDRAILLDAPLAFDLFVTKAF